MVNSLFSWLGGGLKGEAPAFHNRDPFLEYFQDNWIEGNYPLRVWNM